ncbi:dienelactone hydrolase family protein [Kineosporia sp. J2-2]|uniref:Dienelactone hydrolase family protein n=1 Tax=Kineosporia corallincola TaxID=2835133 RepID=A0ABS5TKT0_9ACTN|nr:dienelactone hydrolase family protein [Kineosporia corallincola]MBT0770786.1 dienelactone hydrolase family protein [Kineosporia corallincola]
MTTTTAACLIPAGRVELGADILFPDQYPAESPTGVVLFAHGSGSSRFSPRNRAVAAELNRRGLAAVLTDLLTDDEEQVDGHTAQYRFDIHLLTERLIAVVDWATDEPSLSGLPIGTFGASTGAAAALGAAAYRGADVRAVVSRGGRPDLAGPVLEEVTAPTLFIVGANDPTVRELNEQTMAVLSAPTQLHVIPRATHLFPEPGALEEVSRRAGEWFQQYLAGEG